MPTLINFPELEEQIRADRAERKIDRHDEVWDGTYIITPPLDVEHQEIRTGLMTAIHLAFGFSSPTRIYLGVNISDRSDDWMQNYRCPDGVVVLPGSTSRECDAYYLGGPDFVIEIISPSDRSREKIPFYGQVGVRELLLVDRDPWALELHRLHDGQLEIAGRSTLERLDVLPSNVLPMAFRLVPGDERPAIEVTHSDGVQKWVV